MPYGERDVRYSEFQAPIIRYGGGLVGTHILSLHAHLLNLRDVSLNSLHKLQLTLLILQLRVPTTRSPSSSAVYGNPHYAQHPNITLPLFEPHVCRPYHKSEVELNESSSHCSLDVLSCH
jgi:hypothetical protein